MEYLTQSSNHLIPHPPNERKRHVHNFDSIHLNHTSVEVLPLKNYLYRAQSEDSQI